MGVKAVITFKDEQGFYLTDAEAEALLKQQLEARAPKHKCPIHWQFAVDNKLPDVFGCDHCMRYYHQANRVKVDFLMDIIMGEAI